MTGSRRARLVVPCLALVLVVAGVLLWVRGTTTAPTSAVPAAPSPSPSTAASASAAIKDGRQTIEYGGVQVDVPAAWARVDSSGCEFRLEMWAPPGSPRCRLTNGVVFYGAATFDAAHGPGVRQEKGGTWAGYAYAGSYAVYAADADRDLLQEVLDSARPPR
jgi:hypothetical protein